MTANPRFTGNPTWLETPHGDVLDFDGLEDRLDFQENQTDTEVEPMRVTIVSTVCFATAAVICVLVSRSFGTEMGIMFLLLGLGFAFAAGGCLALGLAAREAEKREEEKREAVKRELRPRFEP